MWTSTGGPRAVPLSLRFEVGERDAEVLAVAVDEHGLAAGVDHRERGCHERVGGAEHRLVRGCRRTPARPSPPRTNSRTRRSQGAFHSAQAASKRSTSSPSVQRCESRTSSQSSWRRTRSRSSNPIANAVGSSAVEELSVIAEGIRRDPLCPVAAEGYQWAMRQRPARGSTCGQRAGSGPATNSHHASSARARAARPARRTGSPCETRTASIGSSNRGRSRSRSFTTERPLGR